MPKHKPIHPLVDLLIFSNLWIAFAAAAMYAATCFIVGVAAPDRLIITIACLTFTAYNYLRLRNFSNPNFKHSPLTSWMQKHTKYLYAAIVFAIAIALYTFLTTKYTYSIVLQVLSIAGLLGLLYAGIDGKMNIRRISLLKTPLVALVWVIVTTALPIVLTGMPLVQHWTLLLGHFLFILGLTIPFEIRDLKADKEDQLLHTVPMAIGVKNTKHLANACIALAFLLILYTSQLVYLFPIPLITMLLISNLNENRSEYWYTGALDYIIILYGVQVAFFT